MSEINKINVNDMSRMDSILKDNEFNDYMFKNENWEKPRKFCKHDLNHVADTARIAWIYCLENNIDIKKDVVYAAGILHDIGKFLQYENGEPHNESSARLAEPILSRSGYNNEEISAIKSAILSHREKNENDCNSNSLNYILYYADKKSRNCFHCSEYDKCSWSNDKKNKSIT